MKSIMEEASSIGKAIDLAWNRAGKPAQFSIKILEEPEKNMFGLTVKSAKIALFFDERRRQEFQQRQPERPRPARQDAPKHKVQEVTPKEAPKQAKRSRPGWTDAMAADAKNWLNETLKAMQLERISYNSSISGSAIKFVFDSSPTGSEAKDRMLFSSFACLLLATLRNKHKRNMRNLKVILLTS